MPTYKALTGLSYGNKTVKAGEVVDDVPAKSIKWLREQNLIVQVDGKGAVLEVKGAAADVSADLEAEDN